MAQNVGGAHIEITAGSQQAERQLSGFEGRVRRTARIVRRVSDGMTGFRTTTRDIQQMSAETQRMHNEMRQAQTKTRQNMMKFREDMIKVQYGYHKLAEGASEYVGTNKDFMNEIAALGQRDKKIKEEMMANNDHMKASFFKSVGAMMARSSQASKIGDNFKQMGGIMNNANRPLLAIADKMDRIARAGTPAALALKQLGPNANMKQLNDRMRMITAGVARFQSVALAAGVAGAVFYSSLHKGAKKASKEYATAWKEMVDSVKKMFEPLVDAFADIMTPVYKGIKFVADLIVEFQKANPTLTKLIASMIVLVPLLTALLSPLAVGIGLWAGIQAAMAAMSPIMTPLITGFASIMGTVVVVSAAIVALGAAFIYLYKHSSEFRAFINKLRDGIKVAFAAIYDYVDKMIKRVKEIAKAIMEWEGFIPVLLGIVSAIAAYNAVMLAMKIKTLATTLAIIAQQKAIKAAAAVQRLYTAAMVAFNLAGGGLKGVLAVLRLGVLKLNAALLLNPIGIVVALIVGLGVALVVAYKRSETFRKIVNGAWSKIKSVAKGVFGWFTQELPKLMKRFKDWADGVYDATVGGIRSMRDKVVGFFKNLIDGANKMYKKTIDAIRGFKNSLVDGFKAAWKIAKDVSYKAAQKIVQFIVDAVKFYVYVFKNWKPLMKKGVSALWDIIKSGFSKIWNYVKKIGSSIVKWAKELPGRLVAGIKSTWKSFSGYMTNRWKALKDMTAAVIRALVKYFKELPGKTVSALKTTWKNFSGYISGRWKALKDNTSNLIKAVVKYFKELPGRMKAAISNTWKTFLKWYVYKVLELRQKVIDFAKKVVQYFKDLPGRIQKAFKSTWQKIKDTFTSILKTIRDKVSSTFKTVVDWAKNLPGRIGNAIKNAAKKTFSAVSSLASGIKKRITDTFNNIVSAAKGLPKRIGDGFKKMKDNAYSGVVAVANKLMSGMGKAVNGLVKGVNFILKKLDIKDRLPEWKVPKYAKGTDGHPGGLAILGDGGGRELFRTPDGMTALSPAKDTMYNLPEGTTVLSAEKTRRLLGRVPRYAKGIGSYWNDALDWTQDKYKKVKSKAADVKDFFKDKVKDIWDYASKPSKLIDMMVKGLNLKPPSGEGIGKIARGGMNKLIKSVKSYIKDKFDMFMGDGEGGVNVFKGLTKTQGFGKAGGQNGYFHHDGVDFAGKLGTIIKSVTDGKVKFAGMTTSGYGGGFGNLVKIAQGAYEHFYGHLQKVLVTNGQPVRAGSTVIGKLGSTGNSTGPHVHYEVRKNGVPVDPMPFLTGKKLGGSLSSWISKAMKIAGVKGANWHSGLMTIAKNESGGNPNAINDWDVNAKAGIPSKGLMQTIGPTFSAYMKKGYGNIMNPVDNTIAAIRYILDRYGSISNVPGVIARRLGKPYVGYETGGFIQKQQTIVAGEGNKREVIIPLQNKKYMQPFADAVSAGMNNDGGVVYQQTVNVQHVAKSPVQVAKEVRKASARQAKEWGL